MKYYEARLVKLTKPKHSKLIQTFDDACAAKAARKHFNSLLDWLAVPDGTYCHIDFVDDETDERREMSDSDLDMVNVMTLSKRK